MTDCLFCKIIAGHLPVDVQYQDENVIVFPDIHPQAPIHLLIVPQSHIGTLNDINDGDITGHMIKAGVTVAKKVGISQNGYRLVMNCEKQGGQSVFHIHCHLLGGRQMTWPPG